MTRLKHIYLALTIMSSLAYSQDVHNSSSIFIPNTISVYIDNVNNNGFIQNNGAIEITGDWKNTSIYQGLGTIVLSGSDQAIDNNNQDIQNLLVDGGGIKSLGGNIAINGSLELANGIIKVNSNQNLLIDDEGTIEGGSTSSFIEGALRIKGTGYKFFPVGTNKTYYPITLTDVQGLNPVIEINSFQDFPNVSTDHEIDINQSYYWTQKLIEGSYSGSPVMVPYNVNDEKIAFVTADNFKDQFNVIETETGNGSITSKDNIRQSIIAIGTVPPEPVQPGYLSTSMSPNAQNPDNRLIKLFGSEMSDTNFSFVVFNRWGNLLFESRSLTAMASDGWDGKHNGQLLPAGAYPYKLTYVDHEGREGNKTGFITIVY